MDEQPDVTETQNMPESESIPQSTASVPDPADLGYKETDVFAWANNLFQYKEDLKIELFLISKNYVLYRAKVHAELEKQLAEIRRAA